MKINVLHLIKKNNLKMSDVDLLGFKENIDAYISNADLCTLTSRYEGMSNFYSKHAPLEKKLFVLTRLEAIEKLPPLMRIFTLLMLIMQIKLLNSFIKLELI